MTTSAYPLKIRHAGSSLVHIAERTGINARTPCGCTPGAGYYTVVAVGDITCPSCRQLQRATPSEG